MIDHIQRRLVDLFGSLDVFVDTLFVTLFVTLAVSTGYLLHSQRRTRQSTESAAPSSSCSLASKAQDAAKISQVEKAWYVFLFPYACSHFVWERMRACAVDAGSGKTENQRLRRRWHRWSSAPALLAAMCALMPACMHACVRLCEQDSTPEDLAAGQVSTITRVCECTAMARGHTCTRKCTVPRARCGACRRTQAQAGMHISMHVSIHMSVNMSLHKCIHMSIHVALHMDMHMSMHISIHLSVQYESSQAPLIRAARSGDAAAVRRLLAMRDSKSVRRMPCRAVPLRRAVPCHACGAVLAAVADPCALASACVRHSPAASLASYGA